MLVKDCLFCINDPSSVMSTTMKWYDLKSVSNSLNFVRSVWAERWSADNSKGLPSSSKVQPFRRVIEEQTTPLRFRLVALHFRLVDRFRSSSDIVNSSTTKKFTVRELTWQLSWCWLEKTDTTIDQQSKSLWKQQLVLRISRLDGPKCWGFFSIRSDITIFVEVNFNRSNVPFYHLTAGTWDQ